ncbi:glycosyltransferase family 10 [Rhodobacteraceae bacterium KMM 6894]|nr:glycosyltransferase family 10 [Rhodobacteraceae bacterium KMM 6894]
MSQTAPRIAVLPSDMKLGRRPGAIALERLVWPLGVPDGIAGGVLGDLGPEDHLIVFPRKTVHVRPSFGTRARVSIMVLEPPAIHGAHLRALRYSWRRFFRVLSYDAALLAAIPNGVFFAHGGTWVPEWRDLTLDKSRMISLIASDKRSQEGHRLRHQIADWARSAGLDLDVMGRGYTPFEAKADGLAPYRYSVVIENGRVPNYFTEKLLDAILCQTVPIYWGCPNIGEFMDTSGMIICDSETALQDAIKGISSEDYAARLPALRALEPTAEHYGDILKRAAEIVRDAAKVG